MNYLNTFIDIFYFLIAPILGIIGIIFTIGLIMLISHIIKDEINKEKERR